MSRSLYDEDGVDGPWLKAMEERPIVRDYAGGGYPVPNPDTDPRMRNCKHCGARLYPEQLCTRSHYNENDRLAAARKALALAQAKSDKAAAARAALPPGSSRARVTSANARWAVAAEARDRAAAALAKIEAEARGGAA